MKTTMSGPINNFHDVIIHEYKPNETIVSECALNDRFFVILRGEAEIFQNNKSIRILKDGDIFGLENFYLNRTYTTSAVAVTPTRIAIYPTNMIREIIYNRPSLTEKILQSIMTQLEQTTQVAEEHIPLENIVDINEIIYHDGDIIIEEGTTGTDIYQLIETERGLLVTRDGKEVGTITHPGEYFGELSALLKQKRAATVRSLGRSVVKVFPGDNLEVLLNTYPVLAKILIETLAQRLIKADIKITDLSQGITHI